MSQERQSGSATTELLRGLALGLPAGHRLSAHSHAWGQLIQASAGTMEVDARRRRWVVPPGRALWVPPEVPHAIVCVGRVDMRTIYVPPDGAESLGREIRVLPAPPLVRELIAHVIGIAPLQADVPAHRRLQGVLLDLLADLDELALELPWPIDPRAAVVAAALWRAPADDATVSDLATYADTSPRTLERAFRRDTGMSIGQWRRQARLLAAVRRLGEGHSVTDVALAVGYSTTSAFVAMFRRELGVTPGRLT